MDDLSQKLAGILNDPESMERVRKMAESILSDDNGQPQSASNTPDLGNLPSGDELNAIMSIVTRLNSSKDDERTHLLNALKPYLSKKRQAKTENAIKLLKLLELLPLLKDSGLFKF